MTELRPILQDDPNAAEAGLLSAAQLDVPSPGSKHRLLATFGLGATTLATTAAASTAAPGTSMAISVVTRAGIAKWLALGALAGTAMTGTGELVRFASETHHARATAHGAETSVAARLPAQSSRAGEGSSFVAFADPPAPSIEPRRDDAPAASARPSSSPATSRNARSAPSDPAPARTLAEEVAALDAARAALDTHNASAALHALDAHDAAFPAPLLGPEVELLRIEALFAAHRIEEARAAGERFLSSHPGSTHARRVRTLLASMGAR
jgi:hypothetical protein